MSSEMNKLAKQLREVMSESDRSKTKPYDPTAVVTKVDGDTVWVHIEGGADETPVERTINAKVGDTVKLRISGGRAWIVGNNTAPPTDDTTAIAAEKTAVKAREVAEGAKEAADTAWNYADSAHKAADTAWEWADDAHKAASEAQTSADAAYKAAGEAQDSAQEANYAANGALTQLSVVEDVVGTLNWISDHGTYTKTEDTEIDPNKTYFIKINNVYTPVAEPSADQLKKYYELTIDDSIQNYISTHLALTDEGLYVVKDDLGYKILLANDGMKVYDAEGHLVSTFGEYIRFSSEKPQYIGSDDAYIIFDPKTGQINIGGNVVLGGDLTLDKLLSEVNSLEVEYTLNEDSSIAHFEAHILRGHEEVTTEFDPRCFTWYYKTEDGEQQIVNASGVNYGYAMDVNINELFDYEGHIITHFTHSYVNYYIENGNAYVDAEYVDSEHIGEYGFTIDEYGDLIYSYDDRTVADFDISDGKLRALNQYGIFGNRLTRETAIYKKGALAAALASKAENQDFFQATQEIYIQATSATANVSAIPVTPTIDRDPWNYWVTYEGESVVSVDPTVKPPRAEAGLTPRWTLKKPTYQSNYPVIFIAKQTMTKKVDGTLEISCTKPLMDDSQTIIDGGHITTGTIDANKVNVHNIDADNIKSGTLDTERLDAEEVKAKIVKTTELLLQNISDLKNYIGLTADGMEIFKGSNSVAKYGDNVRIGKQNGNRLILAGNKMSFYQNSDEQNPAKLSFFNTTNSTGIDLSSEFGLKEAIVATQAGENLTSIVLSVTEDGQHYGSVDVQEDRMGASVYDSSAGKQRNWNITDKGETILPGALTLYETSPMVDHIVYESVSDGWTYRQWYSGKVEAWATVTFQNVNFTSTSTGILRSDQLTANIPQYIFDSTPLLYTSVTNSETVLSASFSATSATSFTGRIFKIGNVAPATVALNVYAIQL